MEGYSLTEAMMATCVNPVQGPNKIGSVGMPLPDVFVRIVDSEDEATILPSGATGEVCLSAPQLMRGFWNRPDETAAALRHHADTGPDRLWLHTGDLGFLDKHRGRRQAERARRLLLVSLRLRGWVFPGQRGRTYAETARWLAGSSVEELLG